MTQKRAARDTILVTGGCGFIGSNFIRFLFENSPQVRIINLDKLTYAGNSNNLLDLETKEAKIPLNKKRYIFIQGDICDSLLLDSIFKKYSFKKVIHFAAETHVDRSIFNFSDFIRTNIEGTRCLIEAVRKYSVKKFIHISTDEVYGSITKGYISETAPLQPSNPYSTSKACADLLVQSYIKTYNVPAIIVRGSNNFGPFQYPEKLIPLAISNLIEGKKIPVHGSGKHIRSWLHVYDFSKAIDLVSNSAATGTIFNVAGEQKTNLDILALLAQHLNKKINKNLEFTADRPGADMRYAPNPKKIKSELGWKITNSLADSLPVVVKWYLDNKEWWEQIKIKKEYQDHYKKQSKALWY